MKNKIYILIIVIILSMSTVSIAGEDARFYAKANKAAKSGQLDFAYMNYRYVLNNNPKDRYKSDALFATGEYHFINMNFKLAKDFFSSYINSNEDVKGNLFALAYLLNMAEAEKQESIVSQCRDKILNLEKLSFIFRNKKEYVYRSPLFRDHEAVYSIDKIEFYIEGELFAKVSY